MIKQNFLCLAITLIAICHLPCHSKAQQKEYRPPAEQNKVSLSVLPAVGGFLDKSEAAFGLGATVSLRQKNHCWMIRCVGLTEFSLGTPNESDQSIDAGILYGIEHRQKRWKFSAAAGAGYYRYINRDAVYSNPGITYITTITSKKNTIGFPFQGSVSFQPTAFGFGFHFGGNFNSVRSALYGGLIYTIRF